MSPRRPRFLQITLSSAWRFSTLDGVQRAVERLRQLGGVLDSLAVAARRLAHHLVLGRGIEIGQDHVAGARGPAVARDHDVTARLTAFQARLLKTTNSTGRS